MLNIKDPRAHELARELAERRGVSMTRAVVDALEKDLDAVRAADHDAVAARQEKLLAAVRQFWADKGLTPGGTTMAEIDAEMYDEDGRPR
ncbi:type II toxin-antitoxin system VapB family antitoxin [Chthonobacter rhizosphaerae]|uniref:type II toxin-antitoxin system VapB family antitoxin n=1 Tax=Chthonobacter rhizosphaerae TaxID=2735553 RepID=UPI0015EF76A8